jgi:cold shock CspA family protein
MDRDLEVEWADGKVGRMRGTITKLVRTHGSEWGRIRPQGTSRDTFFNPASFVRTDGFANAAEGLAVDFDEEADRVNGTHAVHLEFAAEALASSDFSGPLGR